MPGWLWWVVVLVLIGIEMMTGTFYLLALAIAFAAGGIADWLGASWIAQLVATGVVGVIGIAAAWWWQHRVKRDDKAAMMPLDVGQRVTVIEWGDAGAARVFYRGTQWDARAARPETRQEKDMVVTDVQGSILIIDNLKS